MKNYLITKNRYNKTQIRMYFLKEITYSDPKNIKINTKYTKISEPSP